MAGKKVFLLSNLSRASDIGLLQLHGILHAKAYIHDKKTRLWKRLPELTKEMGNQNNRSDISLDAFIFSATPFKDLYTYLNNRTWDRIKFAEKHILFPERISGYDYMGAILY